MANEKVKLRAAGAGVRHWQIAAELGISEYKLCRMLRTELNQEDKNLIYAAIEKISRIQEVERANA